MANRLILIITLAIASVAQMSAQGVIGSLKLHPVFGNTITNIIDTGDVIYYVSDNTLYSYDKANDESDSYSRNNRLNDCSIKDIYYNNDRKYLAVVYENSNIDLLTDDGGTISLPEIYNAEVQGERTINDVTFAPGRMIVSTAFGYVVYNDDRHEVEFSRIFNTNVVSAVATKNYIWVNADSLYYGDLDNPPMTLAEMNATTLHENAKLMPKPNDPTTDDGIIFMGGWTYRLSINEGMFYENVVAQMLVAKGRKLFYYAHYDEGLKRNDIEIDFLLSNESKLNFKVFPVEVKSSKNYSMVSLDKFKTRFKGRVGGSIVIHPRNFSSTEDVKKYPPYMIPLLFS